VLIIYIIFIKYFEHHFWMASVYRSFYFIRWRLLIPAVSLHLFNLIQQSFFINFQLWIWNEKLNALVIFLHKVILFIIVDAIWTIWTYFAHFNILAIFWLFYFYWGPKYQISNSFWAFISYLVFETYLYRKL
jgi:hypothetical protein